MLKDFLINMLNSHVVAMKGANSIWTSKERVSPFEVVQLEITEEQETEILTNGIPICWNDCSGQTGCLKVDDVNSPTCIMRVS